MTPKFLLHDVKEYLKLYTSSFKLLRWNVLHVDEIFQFEFFLSANLRHTLHNELLLNTSYLCLQ